MIIPGSARGEPIGDWPSLFDQIRARPGMWLGSQSTTGLMHFLDGIHQAERIDQVPPERRLGGFAFHAFEDWV